MNILIASVGSYGDVHPFLGLGRTLRDRGHSITFIGNDIYQPLAQRLGFSFVSSGTAEEFREIVNNPDMWHPTRALKTLAASVADLTPIYYDAIAERNVPGDTVVIMTSLAFGARVAQEKLGIPTVSIHLSPSIFYTIYDTPLLPPLPIRDWQPRWLKKLILGFAYSVVVDAALAPRLNEFRRGLGLAPVKGIFRDWYHTPELTIGFFPDWFGPPQPDWPRQTKLVGFPLYDEQDVTPVPADVDEFFAAGSPPILFTPGSAMVHGRPFFEAAVAACQRLGRRGVLLTRHRDHVPENLPDTVRHVEFVPFSKVLPRAAALVHHGGIGTMSQALAAGVPQLVMPMSHDQPDNANRAKKLGVARVVPAKKFNADSATNALAGLIDAPGVNAACKSVAAKFEGVDGLGSAANLVESMNLARRN